MHEAHYLQWVRKKKKGHLSTVAKNLASLRQSMPVVWITTLESLYNIWSKLFFENDASPGDVQLCRSHQGQA